MRILAIDPSGSYNEGKGQSGWVVMEDSKIITFGILKATDYDTKEDYWLAHSELINEKVWENTKTEIVIENFRLYGHRASAQINSEMETVRLLGHLEMWCFNENIKINYQMAVQVKKRFSDDILLRLNYITKDNNGRYYINGINVAGHVVDALRHACLFDLTKGKR